MLWEQHSSRVTGVASYSVKAIMLPLLEAAVKNALAASEKYPAVSVASNLPRGFVSLKQLEVTALTLT